MRSKCNVVEMGWIAVQTYLGGKESALCSQLPAYAVSTRVVWKTPDSVLK